jgi:pyrimidine deaminase RibD-like protein
MPIKINGETYYNTLEACEKTGISRASCFDGLNVAFYKKTSTTKVVGGYLQRKI